ncbi:MAG: NAD-dependent epimerase/dehydratase family protein [Defluviitaleaceae bacterium]|nr:NAD-dependent epimerase/dehydratase family protein [Defluviitaleaceae bacterium]
MKILVVGGTRFAGIHLVKELLSFGHEVTIATRGIAKDGFGDTVKRIILERTDKESISNVLKGKSYDIVYDSQANSSNEVEYLLEAVNCGKYIVTSTASVYYPNFRLLMPESDFEPAKYPLKWCARDDFEYDEIKRQVECAVFQKYSHIKSIAVRFPLVIGEDDYTKRLYFYVEHIVKSQPMAIDNLNTKMAFIMSHEAGKFLAWLGDKEFCGSINAGNCGSIALSEIISYVEEKASVKAIFSSDGEQAPFNDFTDYSLDLSIAEKIGHKFPNISTYIYDLLDKYIRTSGQ